MKNKKHQHKTIHQRIDAVWRHRVSLTLVLLLMIVGVISFDSKMRNLAQDVYASGWGWIGTYLHHEHPPHLHSMSSRPRISTISGSAN
ncbi:MAG: hypothetical protein ABWX94_03710 [Candidatus Saccharimonadales bacterium]